MFFTWALQDLDWALCGCSIRSGFGNFAGCLANSWNEGAGRKDLQQESIVCDLSSWGLWAGVSIYVNKARLIIQPIYQEVVQCNLDKRI